MSANEKLLRARATINEPQKAGVSSRVFGRFALQTALSDARVRCILSAASLLVGMSFDQITYGYSDPSYHYLVMICNFLLNE